MRHKKWCTSTGELSVLTAIADHMNKDLRASFPSHATLAAETFMSARSVGTHVRALAKRGVIVPGDPAAVAHIRPDRRPPVWDFPVDLPKEPPATGNDFHPSEGLASDEHGVRVAAAATRKRGTGGKSAQPRVETVADEPGTAEPGENVGGDGRRPSTGSSGAGAGGRAASSKQRSGSKVSAADLRRVVEGIPAPLTGQLAVEFPHGLPATVLQEAVAKALLDEQRTVEQLVERVERRWLQWSYEDDAVSVSGRGLDRPVGVLLTLLGPSACWGSHARCEDGVDLDTGLACPRCEEARQDKAAELRGEQVQAETRYGVPFRRPVEAGPSPYVLCLGSGCGRKMMPSHDGLCRECREFAPA
ncbi:hypothetical protein ABT224_19970 [Streptomyces sp. NPDC001584]|uniref:hypothetical protein n=1 Tax=Streptomyces sp. NPDC001584 TaxID=3154521 RepID=UPI00332DE1AA